MQFFLVYVTLSFIHECGHLVSAKLLNFKIEKLGFSLFPIPHIFVIASSFQENRLRDIIYYLSGPVVVIIIIGVLRLFGLLNIKSIALAGYIRILLDLNPFYSDITLLIGDEYRFNPLWYLHLFSWGIMVYLGKFIFQGSGP